MVLWRWLALDEEGNTIKGVDEGVSIEFMVSQLRQQKLYPLKIRKDHLRSFITGFKAIDNKLYWSRAAYKIGSLLEAGIPLVTVLEIMTDKESNGYRKKAWQRLTWSVRAGNELGTGLRDFKPSLGSHLQALVIIGEKSGTLAKSFLEIASFLEEEHNFQQKIKTALFYPSLLLGIAVIIIYLLSVLVLPMYGTLFDSLDAQLPAVTTVVFSAGALVPYFLVVFILTIVILLLWKKRDETKPISDLLYFTPWISRIKRYQDLILFCSLLERLLTAGIPLLQSLKLVEEAVQGKAVKKLVKDLTFEVNEGKRLAPVFAASSFFPGEAARMIGVAEESGRLSEMLRYMTRIFRIELDLKLERWTSLLQPLLILWIAGIVGLVAVGVLLPIFEMSTYIR